MQLVKYDVHTTSKIKSVHANLYHILLLPCPLQEIEKRFEARRNNNLEDPDATPLHIAAFKDKPDVAEVLLDHGADPNIRDKFGMTPLHVAAMRGNVELVRRLVEVGATPDALDCLVKTPSDVAEDNEHKPVANYLKGVKYLPIAAVS